MNFATLCPNISVGRNATSVRRGLSHAKLISDLPCMNVAVQVISDSKEDYICSIVGAGVFPVAWVRHTARKFPHAGIAMIG